MRLKSRVLMLALMATLPTVASAAPLHTVYVESNLAGAGTNSIYAFHRGDDGALSPIVGSPFATGGTGVVDSSFALGPFDSDQEITVDHDHGLLFAVNGGSNTISVFSICDKDGTLTPVAGSPFASQGIQPVSIGYENGVLVVVNKHQDPAQAADPSLPNYVSFTVSPDGTLTYIPGSKVEVAAGSSPSQALIHAGFVFGTDFMGGLIQSFGLNGGWLEQNLPVALPDSEFVGSAAPRFPLNMAAHPTSPVLYVDFVTTNKIGVYSYDALGNPTFVRTASVTGNAPCWLLTNGAGDRLYAVNTADQSISVLDTSDPWNPKEIHKTTAGGAVGGLFQEALDRDGTYLYVVEQRDSATIPQGQGNALHVFRVDAKDGTPTEVGTPVPFAVPGDTRVQGVVTY